MCEHCWFDFSRCLSSLLKVLLLVSSFRLVGKRFHSFAPFAEKTDWPKDVLYMGTRQSPLMEARVFARRELWRLMANSDNSGDTWLFTHLKNNWRLLKLIRLSKVKRLCFFRMPQWCQFPVHDFYCLFVYWKDRF